MIALIEAAIVQRLRQGLGKLVTGVHSYGGELDDEGLYQVVQQLPATWVTFAGIDKTEAVKTSRTKHKAEAKFVVMVAARSLRSEETSRTGGIGHWENRRRWFCSEWCAAALGLPESWRWSPNDLAAIVPALKRQA